MSGADFVSWTPFLKHFALRMETSMASLQMLRRQGPGVSTAVAGHEKPVGWEMLQLCEVLKVDPRTKEVELFGGPFEGRQKWCLGHDRLMLLNIGGPCWAMLEGDD